MIHFLGTQGSGHGDLIVLGMCPFFDGVFEDQFGVWVAGFGGGEVLAELGGGDCFGLGG